MGNEEPHYAIAMPGADIGQVADPTEKTCENCQAAKGLLGVVNTASQFFAKVGLCSLGGRGIYDCYDNIVTSLNADGVLTSGYSRGEDEFGLVLKPEGVGKCSHGGMLDPSTGVVGIGGINKDSDNIMFSPHWYLHDKANALAEAATLYFLQQLRSEVGDEDFAIYLNLRSITTLAIVVDMSAYMEPQLALIKRRIGEIVKQYETGNSPATVTKFILVPFDHNGVHYTFSTGRSSEYLKNVSRLEVNKPNSSQPSQSSVLTFAAIGSALELCKSRTNIFVFTSAPPKDPELFHWILATAQSQLISIFFLGDLTLPTQGRGSAKSPTAFYFDLALFTSGHVLTLGSDEISRYQLTAILSTYKSGDIVALARLERVEVTQRSLWIQVDSSITSLAVFVRSDSATPRLEIRYGGTLMSYEALLNTTTTTIGILKYPKVGSYNVTISSSIPGWSVEIAAFSNLDVSFDLYFSDNNYPHPGLEPIQGNPVVGANLTANIRVSQAVVPKSVRLLSIHGELLNQLELTFDENQNVYQTPVVVPDRPFYAEVRGVEFQRLSSRLFTPTFLSLQPLDDTFFLTPGENLSLTFNLTNFAPSQSQVQLSATDTLSYIRGFSPQSVSLSELEATEGQIDFFVPKNSQIDVAASLAMLAHVDMPDGSVNYNYFEAIVAIDVYPPKCKIQNSTLAKRCTQPEALQNCSSYDWSALIRFSDKKTPLENFTLSHVNGRFEFSSSHNDVKGLLNTEVFTVLSGDCCVLNATLTVANAAGRLTSCTVTRNRQIVTERQKFRIGGLTPGAIAGIAIAVIAVIVIVAMAKSKCFWC